MNSGYALYLPYQGYLFVVNKQVAPLGHIDQAYITYSESTLISNDDPVKTGYSSVRGKKKGYFLLCQMNTCSPA